MFDGFSELAKELSLISSNVSNIESILEIGASEFVKDLSKLPKPKSKINNAKHTHLIDSFSYSKSKKRRGEIEVGWGVYYGPLVEQGTKLMNKQPHLEPLFTSKAEKYYKLMLEKIL